MSVRAAQYARKGVRNVNSQALVIVVATHKPYAFPGEACYLPVQAGAALNAALPFQSDAEGDSISERNPFWCELTALYWAWKNQPADFLGLMHYRRYLGHGKRIATGEELRRALEKAPILLPRKRRYWIETNESQYVHAHGQESLTALKELMAQRCPEYLPAFERSLRKTSGHRFNMFVMRRDLCDEYCAWLFDLLFALESQRQDVEFPRIYGFLSERLMDCWLDCRGYAYREMTVVNTEPQRWLQKGWHFLKRKLTYTPAKETPV